MAAKQLVLPVKSLTAYDRSTQQAGQAITPSVSSSGELIRPPFDARGTTNLVGHSLPVLASVACSTATFATA